MKSLQSSNGAELVELKAGLGAGSAWLSELLHGANFAPGFFLLLLKRTCLTFPEGIGGNPECSLNLEAGGSRAAQSCVEGSPELDLTLFLFTFCATLLSPSGPTGSAGAALLSLQKLPVGDITIYFSQFYFLKVFSLICKAIF